jgi:hypothetical protein
MDDGVVSLARNDRATGSFLLQETTGQLGRFSCKKRPGNWVVSLARNDRIVFVEEP